MEAAGPPGAVAENMLGELGQYSLTVDALAPNFVIQTAMVLIMQENRYLSSSREDFNCLYHLVFRKW